MGWLAMEVVVVPSIVGMLAVLPSGSLVGYLVVVFLIVNSILGNKEITTDLVIPVEGKNNYLAPSHQHLQLFYIVSQTYLFPFHTERVHFQSIQIPGETLIKRPKGIMQFRQVADIRSESSRFIVQIRQSCL